MKISILNVSVYNENSSYKSSNMYLGIIQISLNSTLLIMEENAACLLAYFKENWQIYRKKKKSERTVSKRSI